MRLIVLLVSLHAVTATEFCGFDGIINITDLGPSPRANLDFPSLTKYDGYPCENHYVTTEDNYILGLFRIPLSASCPSNSSEKEPVMFFHGLLLDSSGCIVPGPKKAHCYNFADDCNDVWTVNNRGNRYSRNHTYLSPDDPLFWNFSFHHMATLDAAAAIDYVLKVTNKSQVVIAGHSQGVTSCVVLCAKRPEFNGKIKIGFAMSPVSWLDDAKFFGLDVIAALSTLVDGAANNSSNVEIFPHGGLGDAAATVLCGQSKLQYPLCVSILFASLGYDKCQISADTMRVLGPSLTGGSSFKTVIYWGQVKKYGFCEYNYGPEGNMKVYGQVTPPLIDFSNVTSKWVFFAGQSDNVADVKDATRFAGKVKTAVLCVLEELFFQHLDFIFADTLTKYLTSQMLLTLKSGNFICNKYK